MTAVGPLHQPHHIASHRVHCSARYEFRSSTHQKKSMRNILYCRGTHRSISHGHQVRICNSHAFTRQGARQCFCHTDKRILHKGWQSQVIWHHLEMMTRFESNLPIPQFKKKKEVFFYGSKKKTLFIQGETSKQTWHGGQTWHRIGYFSQNAWLHFFDCWGSEQCFLTSPGFHRTGLE